MTAGSRTRVGAVTWPRGRVAAPPRCGRGGARFALCSCARVSWGGGTCLRRELRLRIEPGRGSVRLRLLSDVLPSVSAASSLASATNAAQC